VRVDFQISFKAVEDVGNFEILWKWLKYKFDLHHHY